MPCHQPPFPPLSPSLAPPYLYRAPPPHHHHHHHRWSLYFILPPGLLIATERNSPRVWCYGPFYSLFFGWLAFTVFFVFRNSILVRVHAALRTRRSRLAPTVVVVVIVVTVLGSASGPPTPTPASDSALCRTYMVHGHGPRPYIHIQHRTHATHAQSSSSSSSIPPAALQCALSHANVCAFLERLCPSPAPFLFSSLLAKLPRRALSLRPSSLARRPSLPPPHHLNRAPSTARGTSARSYSPSLSLRGSSTDTRHPKRLPPSENPCTFLSLSTASASASATAPAANARIYRTRRASRILCRRFERFCRFCTRGGVFIPWLGCRRRCCYPVRRSLFPRPPLPGRVESERACARTDAVYACMRPCTESEELEPGIRGAWSPPAPHSHPNPSPNPNTGRPPRIRSSPPPRCLLEGAGASSLSLEARSPREGAGVAGGRSATPPPRARAIDISPRLPALSPRLDVCVLYTAPNPSHRQTHCFMHASRYFVSGFFSLFHYYRFPFPFPHTDVIHPLALAFLLLLLLLLPGALCQLAVQRGSASDAPFIQHLPPSDPLFPPFSRFLASLIARCPAPRSICSYMLGRI
ncbi:hypothetical protein C8Q79DRAFT_212137 [Trametes meyenii]|nr:hypothetical protein C8Q79DRAFT_212137 [Trametes meyenii]